jgi:hypothetical protein
MTTEVSESDVLNTVDKGKKTFIRVFDVLCEYPKKFPEPRYIGLTLLVILGLRKNWSNLKSIMIYFWLVSMEEIIKSKL